MNMQNFYFVTFPALITFNAVNSFAAAQKDYISVDGSQPSTFLFYNVTKHPNWHILDQGNKCGKPKPVIAPRVQGGREANKTEFPWMAELIFGNASINRSACGGSVISKRYIITAAHCAVEDPDDNLKYVRLGGHLSNDVRAKTYELERITPHLEFNYENIGNDIALIRLSEDIKFNLVVAPICLPIFKELTVDKFIERHLQVAGWGLLGKGDLDDTEISLQTTKVKLIHRNECMQTWKKSYISSKTICGDKSSGYGACHGDSGGPLMFGGYVNDQTWKYFIVGIASFTGGKCNTSITMEKPDVYTRVSSYLNWILDNVYE